MWEKIIVQPLYNFLILIIDTLPYHSLAWGIVILTIIIKLIIFVPSHKSMKAQKAMQKIQPEINKIKEQYKKNPQEQAKKTMELYKKHGVNPFGSCLPLLVQFPLLLGLFFVCKNILDPEKHTLLYESLKDFDFNTVNTMIFNVVDIAQKNVFSKYVMPILVGVLQFLQMYRMQMKKEKTPEKKEQAITTKENLLQGAQGMSKMMTYMMPVFVAFIASSYEASLSLYWATSTLFSLLQQEILLRKKS